ncbi:hypothetical protein WS86_06770 [Burkholderia savannae]|nr:hypothetical protein WS86_06770 [Burkholderia savannae]
MRRRGAKLACGGHFFSAFAGSADERPGDRSPKSGGGATTSRRIGARRRGACAAVCSGSAQLLLRFRVSPPRMRPREHRTDTPSDSHRRGVQATRARPNGTAKQQRYVTRFTKKRQRTHAAPENDGERPTREMRRDATQLDVT